jgi:hypothetical protein
VVLRCLARRPEERYASAEDLLSALERLEEILRLRTLTEIRGISQAGSRLLGGSEKGKKTPLYVGLALLALVILAAVGYWLAR